MTVSPPGGDLPEGWVVTLDDTVRLGDGGQTLVGGERTRALVISKKASALVVDRQVTITDATSRKLATTLTAYGMAHPNVSGETHVGDSWRDKLTVVIPVFRRAAALTRALESIGGMCPVVVVDDASPNGLALKHVCDRYGATYYRLDTNVGPAGARNAGIANVTTPLVMVVDSDIEVDDGIWDLARHFADPSVAIVSPRIRARSTPGVPTLLSHYEKFHHSPDRGSKPGSIRPWGRIGWVPSACFLARIDALGAGFDEQMRVGEDVDLVWRVVDQGWRVRYDPSVSVKHRVSDRATDWLVRRFTYGTSAGQLGLNHPDHMTPAVFTPTSLATTLLMATLKPWGLIAAGVVAWAKADQATAAISSSELALDTAVRSAGRGLWGPAKQASALILRHWFPITALLFPFSRHVRRLVGAALVVDTIDSQAGMRATTKEFTRKPLAVVGRALGFFLLRRIDDIGYGKGAWWGALRARSTRSLTPRFIGFQGKDTTD